MLFVSVVSSLLYTLIVGSLFVFIFIIFYDFFYGEKKEKQIRKIHKHFSKENIKKVELLDHQPKKFSLYQIKTDKETKRIKLKPGYKIVKLVAKKK
jgi:predicted PurR-regulated permease PerM